MANFKTFCIYPFNQIIARTHGRLSPCCHYTGDANLQSTTLADYWHSTELQHMRTSMVQGKTVSYCDECYNNENINGTSMRIDGLALHNIDSNTDIDSVVAQCQDIAFPERLEVHVGNLCNLKCLSCNAWDSSSILAENRALRLDSQKARDFEISDATLEEILVNLHNGNIKHLDIRGGESLLVPKVKQLLNNLDQKIYQTVRLRIQTNTTYLNEEWKGIFSKFNQVWVSCSIDAIDNQLTYIRYPADWKTVQQNLAWYTQQPNIATTVAVTVTNLNLLCVDKLITWLLERQLDFKLNPTLWPEIFQPSNLPQQLLNIAKQRLSPLISANCNDHINHSVLEKLTSLESLNHNTLWQDFCQTIDMRDGYRGNRIFDVLPEFQQFWKP